ncbi:receptor-mediated endocytosis protein 6 homolog [Drosophila sulfurigaster albostrigata]|uniref:receptor-mediated endocytosis protein 6 homolog n=1 Tax=Drosophila sulfurigaster albostrigata TaxID=89887 RepID=UPI002D219077|nr:receptor-mediated endocytosis protein 6 homolog [Drosophila sulfurigaster albostrigata]
MKWLESHFGSESTASNDSRDEEATRDVDADVEPTKKSYFNVTIKSQSQLPVGGHNATVPLTHTLPRSTEWEREREREMERDRERERERDREPERERERLPSTLDRKYLKDPGLAGRGGKFYQGISNWAERQEPPLNVNHFSSQAFREDFQETIRRNGLKKKLSGGAPPDGSHSKRKLCAAAAWLKGCGTVHNGSTVGTTAGLFAATAQSQSELLSTG